MAIDRLDSILAKNSWVFFVRLVKKKLNSLFLSFYDSLPVGCFFKKFTRSVWNDDFVQSLKFSEILGTNPSIISLPLFLSLKVINRNELKFKLGILRESFEIFFHISILLKSILPRPSYLSLDLFCDSWDLKLNLLNYQIGVSWNLILSMGLNSSYSDGIYDFLVYSGSVWFLEEYLLENNRFALACSNPLRPLNFSIPISFRAPKSENDYLQAEFN